MSKYIFNNDTDILEFLEQLRENGIQIWGEGEKIRYRSKNRQLAPETLRILKMAKGQILDFFRMIEKNVIPLTSIQTAYVVGQTAGCELGNINAHYYIEYTIESLDVERLEQMINLVISKNDALRLIVTHEGKASFLDNVPYYSVPVYSLYDIKQVGMDQWTWRLTYKVFCGKNIVSTVDSLMSWNYQSVEKILNQLTKMHFRTAKLSETLLLAIKER